VGSMVRFSIRSRLALCAPLVAATAASAGGVATGASPHGGHASAPRPSHTLLVTTGRIAGPVTVGGGYLVWETEGLATAIANGLFQRDLRTGKVRRLSPAPSAQYGLASTSSWVVYARATGTSVQLAAVRHDGSGSVVLARGLIAPIDSRGDLVAWAEEDGPRQRVVVRNMKTGKRWVAADNPRCMRGRCYRIDAVTLADRGVVFDRGAIGPQPSFVVRRGFHDPKPSAVSIPDDPQPDLARSSAGAFYYAFGRGWFRWDFGSRRPHFTGRTSVQPWILDFEGGRLLLTSRSGCRTSLSVRDAGGRVLRIAAPSRTASSPKDFGPLCRDLTGFAWSGRKLIAGWALAPKISVDSHTDVGLVGVVVSSGELP
jgi:hypothetical protein